MKKERKGWVVAEPSNGIPYIEPVEWSCTEDPCCGGENCGLTAKEAKDAVTRFYASEAKHLRQSTVAEFLEEYGYRGHGE